jgi:hypothetical protein
MEHNWKIDGSGQKMQYVCIACGAIEHVFHERIGPDGFKLKPMTVPASCDEEVVRYVLEE